MFFCKLSKQKILATAFFREAIKFRMEQAKPCLIPGRGFFSPPENGKGQHDANTNILNLT